MRKFLLLKDLNIKVDFRRNKGVDYAHIYINGAKVLNNQAVNWNDKIDFEDVKRMITSKYEHYFAKMVHDWNTSANSGIDFKDRLHNYSDGDVFREIFKKLTETETEIGEK